MAGDPPAFFNGTVAGAGNSGPAPFLHKTYDMVDDYSTDHIVSWSFSAKSFIVWNPPEFSRRLLPAYFKHSNFSSFIRQLNTYGFSKIDPERWEFANENFVKDKRHLLKNINRKKPQYSHSQPQSLFGESERAALEEEIERLLREKAALQADLCKSEGLQAGTKPQLEELERQVHSMETRQLRIMSFLAKAMNNPTFVEHIVKMADVFSDLSAINKKRRLQINDLFWEIAENSIGINHSHTPEMWSGHAFHQDFFNKLTLDLSPACSDGNVRSVHSSTEGGITPQKRSSKGDQSEDTMGRESFSFAPDRVDLSDTGTSVSLKMSSFPLRQYSMNVGPQDGEDHISHHLNLTLVSSFQANEVPMLSMEDTELCVDQNDKEANCIASTKKRGSYEGDASHSSDGDISRSKASNNDQENAAPHGRVNDMFWEQFLTDRPASPDSDDGSLRLQSYLDDVKERSRHKNGKELRT